MHWHAYISVQGCVSPSRCVSIYVYASMSLVNVPSCITYATSDCSFDADGGDDDDDAVDDGNGANDDDFGDDDAVADGGDEAAFCFDLPSPCCFSIVPLLSPPAALPPFASS